jgi:prepilin-type N-terminal cleavage/methylation domain-containing protein
MAQATEQSDNFRRRNQHGFSLLELLLTIVILAIVVAVIVSGVTQLQKSSTNQAVNVDLTQESRQFMDQVVEDLHQAGYPDISMFDSATSAANPNLYAAGLVAVSGTAIQYEGDVDGTGVSEVFVQLSPSGGPCPCTLRRGAVTKALYAAGTNPTYYTEVDGVNNLNIFTAYDKAGNVIPLPCAGGVCADGSAMKNIKDIGILLNVRSNTPNVTTGAYTYVTMSTEAQLE